MELGKKYYPICNIPTLDTKIELATNVHMNLGTFNFAPANYACVVFYANKVPEIRSIDSEVKNYFTTVFSMFHNLHTWLSKKKIYLNQRKKSYQKISNLLTCE
jgi:hypothetical protein